MTCNNEAKIIKQLRQQIPVVRCLPGCHDCCNDLIMFTNFEWGQIKDKHIATSLTCPYLGKYGCGIYSRRPIVCRLFGTSKKPLLRCRYGCLPVFPLSEERELKIYYTYIKLLGDDIFEQLAKTADLNKIAKIVETIPNKKSVTRFVERLPERLKKRQVCDLWNQSHLQFAENP